MAIVNIPPFLFLISLYDFYTTIALCGFYTNHRRDRDSRGMGRDFKGFPPQIVPCFLLCTSLMEILWFSNPIYRHILGNPHQIQRHNHLLQIHRLPNDILHIANCAHKEKEVEAWLFLFDKRIKRFAPIFIRVVLHDGQNKRHTLLQDSAAVA